MRSLVLLLALLGVTPAWADLLVIEFTGSVVAINGGENGGSLDHARVGDAVEGMFVFDPDQFPLGSGDGSTFVAIRDPWEFPLDLLRSRLVIGGVPFPTEDPLYPFTLGTSLMRDSTGTSGPGAGPRDSFTVNDWSSPLDLSDTNIVFAPLRIVTLGALTEGASDFVQPPVTSLYPPLDFGLATTRTLSVIEGIGQRRSGGTFAFDCSDPVHACRSVTVALVAVTKGHCQNRIPWVDQGKPFPDRPIGCGVSQRPANTADR